MFGGLQIANDQLTPELFVLQREIATGNDLKGGAQGNVQIGDCGMHGRHVRIIVGQIVLPVKDGITQGTAATWTGANSAATNQV